VPETEHGFVAVKAFPPRKLPAFRLALLGATFGAVLEPIGQRLIAPHATFDWKTFLLGCFCLLIARAVRLYNGVSKS
jgi:drug/metabolite transporter (DMT)-like permease